MYNYIIKFFENPIVVVAFSGFGVVILTFVFGAIKRFLGKQSKNDNKNPTDTLNKYDCIFKNIEDDIDTIKRSIKFDISCNQRLIFIQMYKKYVDYFQDIDSLEESYKYLISNTYSTNVSGYLSQLLGSLESLKLQYINTENPTL